MEVEEDTNEINIVERIIQREEYKEALDLLREQWPKSIKRRLTEQKPNETQKKANNDNFSADQDDNENDNNENKEKQKKGKKEKKKKKGKNPDDEDKPKRKNKRKKVE